MCQQLFEDLVARIAARHELLLRGKHFGAEHLPHPLGLAWERLTGRRRRTAPGADRRLRLIAVNVEEHSGGLLHRSRRRHRSCSPFPIPPHRGRFGSQLPPRRSLLHPRGDDDADRHHHLLRIHATVIAALGAGDVAHLLAEARHERPFRGQHARSPELNLVGGNRCGGDGPPTLPAVRDAGRRAPFEDVAMVACENHRPAGACRLVEECREDPDRAERPPDVDLIGLGEMIVDRVDDRPDDPALGRRDLVADDSGEVAVVELRLRVKHRAPPPLTGRHEPGMGGERGLLVGGVGREAAGEEARARILRLRGDRGERRPDRRAPLLDDLRPSFLLSHVRDQLAADGGRHAVEDDQQHRHDTGDVRDDLVEHLLDEEHLRRIHPHRYGAFQERRELAGATFLFPGGRGMDGGDGVGELPRGREPACRGPGPVDPASLGQIAPRGVG